MGKIRLVLITIDFHDNNNIACIDEFKMTVFEFYIKEVISKCT